jgi:hypothetical protein
MAAVTLAEFRARTVMPGADVDDLEDQQEGWIAQQLVSIESEIIARLRKRYAVPFVEPYPEILKSWIVRVGTLRCYLRRGVDPRDMQFEAIKGDFDRALAEVKEAADAKDGLFDLPLRADTIDTGINQGAPMVYSEADPYTWTDVQRTRVYG